MEQRLTKAELVRGVHILTQQDPDLAAIAATYGPPPLWHRDPGFPTLIHIILEQQVSLASAKAAYDRLCATLTPLTPESFLTLSDAALKTIGFSRQKTRYGRELAHAILAGDLVLEQLPSLNDHDVQEQLTRVKGIGPWTANIYLLMALGRPDCWPSGDLALQIALQRVKQLPQRPNTQATEQWGELWRPWRAIAARLLWQFYLNAPKATSIKSRPKR